ncbi:hypothetical protein CTAYLR_001023 [Chrysophaeum taylorii]|uniref:Uncharacterized protein n=1 Tax=Chrysophaeum taylorii TaxID=2483200 RepID=A0AAD7UFI0_9STRA|nr:hypothetical protein CTAYLR_001023 [Chrysophaeum taylorii]
MEASHTVTEPPMRRVDSAELLDMLIRQMELEETSEMSSSERAVVGRFLGTRDDELGLLREVAKHAWFQDLDVNNVRNLPAPRVPDGGDALPQLLEELKTVELDDNRFHPLISEVTLNFEQPRHGMDAALAASPHHHQKHGPEDDAPDAPPSNPRAAAAPPPTNYYNTARPPQKQRQPCKQAPPDAFVDYTYRRRRPQSVPNTARRTELLSSFESFTKRPALNQKTAPTRRSPGSSSGGYVVADASL